VVTVGLTLTEPLADEGKYAPGVMVRLVAPAVDQVNVLLVPEFMVVGFAVKEVIAGTEPFAEGELVDVPQPASPIQMDRMTINAQKPCPDELSLRAHLCAFSWLVLDIETKSLGEL
jgi:hypothetical protein